MTVVSGFLEFPKTIVTKSDESKFDRDENLAPQMRFANNLFPCGAAAFAKGFVITAISPFPVAEHFY